MLMVFCLVSLREKMKGRMKRRNVACDKVSVRTYSEWKTSLYSQFNFHNPADTRYFCPTQTSCLVFKQLMTCLQLQLFVMSHQRDRVMLSQTSLRKWLLPTLKIGLSPPRVLLAHFPPVCQTQACRPFLVTWVHKDKARQKHVFLSLL